MNPAPTGLWSTPRLSRRLAASAGALALVFGGLLYVLKRPTSLLMFAWIERIGGTEYVQAARQSLAPMVLPSSVVECLPQALWAFALLTLVRATWVGHVGRAGANVAALAIAFALAAELGQGLGFFPGTFDPWDLTLVAVALWCSAVLRVDHLERGSRYADP